MPTRASELAHPHPVRDNLKTFTHRSNALSHEAAMKSLKYRDGKVRALVIETYTIGVFACCRGALRLLTVTFY